MSEEKTYTTGEMARLCGCTVRTVQYYDKRGILVPSDLSEGGRRIYNESDLSKLKVICFLRELNISIEAIREILMEENPGELISMLIKQQADNLESEIEERRTKLRALKELSKSRCLSLENIGDVAYQMKNQDKRKKAIHRLIAVGIVLDIIEIAGILLWVMKGIWQPFVIGLALMTPIGIWASHHYMNVIAYICPKCHEVFKPSKKEMFFAPHTPKTRKLKCSCCGYKGYCVEVSAPEKSEE